MPLIVFLFIFAGLFLAFLMSGDEPDKPRKLLFIEERLELMGETPRELPMLIYITGFDGFSLMCWM